MTRSPRRLPVRTKWLKLGVAIAVLHYVFILGIIILLGLDLNLALAVVLVGSIVGGIALTIFVVYIY